MTIKTLLHVYSSVSGFSDNVESHEEVLSCKDFTNDTDDIFHISVAQLMFSSTMPKI